MSRFEQLREALLLAENFYDGTDYHFDRLAPDEQDEIVTAARLLADILDQGKEMWWCEICAVPATQVGDDPAVVGLWFPRYLLDSPVDKNSEA